MPRPAPIRPAVLTVEFFISCLPEIFPWKALHTSGPYTTTAVDGTIAAFDDTVKHIMKKDFNHCSSDSKICKNCDFRFYCEK